MMYVLILRIRLMKTTHVNVHNKDNRSAVLVHGQTTGMVSP